MLLRKFGSLVFASSLFLSLGDLSARAFEGERAMIEFGARQEIGVGPTARGGFLLKVEALAASDSATGELPVRFIWAHTEAEMTLAPSAYGSPVVNRAKIRFEPAAFGIYDALTGPDNWIQLGILPSEWRRDLDL